MDGANMLVAAVFVLVGAVTGSATRCLLGRLRRGAAVRAGGCEALLAAGWGVTGLGWAAGALPGRLVPVLLGLGWLGVAAGAVDVRHHRLPDALTVPAIPGGLLLLAPLGGVGVARGAAGAVVAVSAYGAVHLLAPGSLGAGDVKLAGSVGAVLAGLCWPAVALAVALAGALTVALALVSGRSVVPHGPCLLAASWVVVAALAVAGAPLGPPGGR